MIYVTISTKPMVGPPDSDPEKDLVLVGQLIPNEKGEYPPTGLHILASRLVECWLEAMTAKAALAGGDCG